MKKTTAYIITDMLQSVVSSGTGTAASLGSRPVAGKTGTTSDYKDAWFAGYTPELVTVVWMGHDEPQRMSGVTGGSYPARIWREVMSKALKEAPVKKFTKPEGIVSSTVCSKSGLKAGENCPEEELVTDIFVKGTVPSKECDVHVLVEVCAESNQIPTAACPERVTRGFVKGEEPTETCTIHTGTARSSGIAVCTDPRHGGIMYAAIIAGPNNSGGCPEEHIQYIDFPYGEGPTAYCYLPDHQLKPKAPSGPTLTCFLLKSFKIGV
jgi:penicillin-binding protein 1A